METDNGTDTRESYPGSSTIWADIRLSYSIAAARIQVQNFVRSARRARYRTPARPGRFSRARREHETR
jgi:hypothetical protein